MDWVDYFYVGYISKTRGLKGEVQLFFEFDDYEALTLDTIFLEIDRQLVPFFVDSAKLLANRTAYLFLEDINHIDKASPLVRKKAYLPISKLPQREPDDFRFTDLKGFDVIDRTWGRLGEIAEVYEYPQHYVAAVHYKGKELLFPLNDELMVSVDVENNRLEVDLPEGLVDLYR